MINQRLLEVNERIYMEKWLEKYEQLRKFYEENHHLNIPCNVGDDTKSLYDWFLKQKNLYKDGNRQQLTDEKIGLLNKIDLNWFETNYSDSRWATNYSYCKEFFEKYGMLTIPLHYEPEGLKIGRWLRCQREKYFGKRLPALEQWQIDALENIGMDWENDTEKWKTYQTSYPEQAIYFYIKQVYPDAKNAYRLGDYEYDIYIPSINTIIEYDGTFHHKDKKKNTDSKRNKYCIDNGITLYRIREQGLNLNIDGVICLVRKNNNIEGLQDVIKELAKRMNINVCIDIDLHRDAVKIVDMYMKVPEVRWMRTFTIVKEYYNKTGTLIGIPDKINNVNVKAFLGRQRKSYKLLGQHTPLSTQKIELLKSVGFEFRTGFPFGIVNSENINDIIQKLNENKVDSAIIDGVKKTLSICENNKHKESIDSRSALSFEEAIKYAESYYKENGHLMVPERYETNDFKLGDWIGWMRKKYYRIQGTPLTNNEIKQLESIGMVWNVSEYVWNEKYKIAKKYYKKFGTINIPGTVEYGGIKLGLWLTCQREIKTGKRAGNLSEKQIKMLENLNFSWEPRDKTKTITPEWMHCFNLLNEYVEFYGYNSLRYNTVYKDKQIYKWYSLQKRTLFKCQKETDVILKKKKYLSAFLEKYDKDFLKNVE